MGYRSISVKPVIARIIRNLRIQETSLIADIHDWVLEAMEEMQTTTVLSPAFKDVQTYFHKAPYPCGMAELIGVVYDGCRIREKTGAMAAFHARKPHHRGEDVIEKSMPAKTVAKEGPGYERWTTLFEDMNMLPVHATEFYEPDHDGIITTFNKGKVRIYYKSVPVDKEGFPLVPDDPNYKKAIEYYVRLKALEQGSIKDNLYRPGELHQLWETFSGRAIGSITYPSVDKVHAFAESWTTLKLPNPETYIR